MTMTTAGPRSHDPAEDPVMIEEPRLSERSLPPSPRAGPNDEELILRPTGARLAGLVLIWTVVAVASMALVLYALAPVFQQRDQRKLLESYRVELQNAAN